MNSLEDKFFPGDLVTLKGHKSIGRRACVWITSDSRDLRIAGYLLSNHVCTIIAIIRNDAFMEHALINVEGTIGYINVYHLQHL